MNGDRVESSRSQRLVLALLLMALGVGAVWFYLDPAGSSPADLASPGQTLETPATTVLPTSSSSLESASSAISTTSTTSTSVVVEPVGLPAFPQPDGPPPESGVEPGFRGVGLVTVASGGALLYTDPDEPETMRVREGIVFPAIGWRGDWIRVLTSCDTPAWVQVGEVAAMAPAAPAAIGAGFDFADAVIVVDPGHGGPNNIGAVGPSGLQEKAVNLVIARRLRDLLTTSHVVDWETGVIYTGNDIPPADTVVLTRVGEGEAGDYEAGLDFRAEIANRVNAHVMVSIHNNAGWELELEFPGSDVYYQSQDALAVESRRLATLLTEEFQVSFSGFDADWVGASFVGAKSRLSPRDGETQYYGLLRYSEVPSVIAEGLYLANASEEALLRTPRAQQAYAEAVYRALVRFLTTDETGDGNSSDPEVWEGSAGSGSARPNCEIPSQGAE